MTLKDVPHCYRIGFADEVANPKDLAKKLKNVFQLGIRDYFKEFLDADLEQFQAAYGHLFRDCVMDEIRATLKGVHPRLPRFAYAFHDPHPREDVYNFIIPKPAQSGEVNFEDYLKEELQFLDGLFLYLSLSSKRFAETEQGKEFLQARLIHQTLDISIVMNHAMPPSVTIELSETGERQMNVFISTHQTAGVSDMIVQMMNAIVQPLDNGEHQISKVTTATVRYGYVELVVWGFDGRTSLFLVESDMMIRTKDIYYPFQAIALMAGFLRMM